MVSLIDKSLKNMGFLLTALFYDDNESQSLFGGRKKSKKYAR